LRVPAGDRAACGVSAEHVAGATLTRARPGKVTSIFINTLLAIMKISEIANAPVSGA
jgi:hypothetical protein